MMPIRRQPFIALPTSFRKHSALCRRPLLQHPRSLPDRQPHPWSLLDEVLEDAMRLSEAIPSERHFLNPLPILAPFLDLVEVAMVGLERVVGFFVGPVVCHDRLNGQHCPFKKVRWKRVSG
jgi:hypothetical protein